MPKSIRPIKIEGNIAYVPLTRGSVAVIDADDAHLVASRNWHLAGKQGAFYAACIDWDGKRQRSLMMHRLIMGEPKGMQVDHKDGNGLNNRRDNLRIATNAENSRNQRMKAANNSGFKGVSKDRNMWRARIKVDGRDIHLGNFPTADAAHAAYCVASEKLHGEFANFGTAYRILPGESA